MQEIPPIGNARTHIHAPAALLSILMVSFVFLLGLGLLFPEIVTKGISVEVARMACGDVDGKLSLGCRELAWHCFPELVGFQDFVR